MMPTTPGQEDVDSDYLIGNFLQLPCLSFSAGFSREWQRRRDALVRMYRSIKRKASEFDALLLPGGVIESRLSTYPTKGGRVRKVVLRCRKTGRLDLPRALDDHRDRRGTRTKGYLMAIAED